MIQLIYASTSGNVEITAEKIAEGLSGHGYEIELTRAEKAGIEKIAKNKKFIFATSTWEHGKLNPFFQNLYSQMALLDFKNKQAAFVGLGDRRYEPLLFCEGMETVRRLWLKNGGGEVCAPLRIQGEPYEYLNTNVKEWANMLATNWSNYNV